MFFFQEGFTYRNFLMDMIAIFAFVVWFWLLIVIYGDLFRRHDISGWGSLAREERGPVRDHLTDHSARDRRVRGQAAMIRILGHRSWPTNFV
jgi:hypothetical protein